jgi:hypothetical protein
MRESLGMSLSESLEELLYTLSCRVTMLWANRWDSYCWESYSATEKALGESMGELLSKRQRCGRVAGCLVKESLGLSLGESLED